ncbi:MAG: polysaccharide deacetylase family protein [Planctomycetes bacterium]|nr:polysaccharide deacetylase family protein [Planctomycetota bacterium]
MRLLYCHYVFDDQVKAFEQILQVLKGIGDFVNTDTCVDMLEGNREIKGRFFHLSFDDGFRNIVTNAVPVLRKYGIPAILFVPTSWAGADWQGAKRFCLEKTGYSGVVEMARWEELKRLTGSGMEVGSHTKNHLHWADLSQDPDLLWEEVAGSKHLLEKQLGRECKYLAWPFGAPVDGNPLFWESVHKAGYRACFGACRGSVQPQQTCKYAIPRHHFEPQWPLSHIRFFASGHMEGGQQGLTSLPGDLEEETTPTPSTAP